MKKTVVKRILVIDDEKEFCFFLKKNLEKRRNFKVYTCWNSQIGVELIKELQPDVILLDIVMPKVNGQEIVAHLKKEEGCKDIPIIYITALVTPKETHKLKYFTGDIRVVAKPAPMNVLLPIIDKTIQQN
jgi:CheY-like chemotaxis protein